jgi:DNA polymerase
MQQPGLVVKTKAPDPATIMWRFDQPSQTLLARLPSGRVIRYPEAAIENGQLQYARIYGGKKVRTATHGGKLLENVDSGFCRDLIFLAQRRLQAQGWDVCMSTHDELAAGTLECCTVTVEEFCDVITTLPPWAKGFPLAAAGWRGKRYRK